MWFIFPQIKGLGRSPISVKYAISSKDEARAYLQHPILGARLKECTRLILLVKGRSALENLWGTGRHEVPLVHDSVRSGLR